ncbi:MoaD/ThiS family protein [Candidatus Bathyarchaeota archaeon]|nr:MoaD/ThiS family protein [Candidatus Bathyarchaeota archaeon]MBS7620744.1 MoaD/ThiS family protein [Candidatus Bathyarchaeota archaeon]MBS7637060.1 MoaD/ThiS family protein [Candidatus Bathyarchaeota archaeon]
MVSVKILLFATLRSKYKTRELAVECDGTLLNMIENASKILGLEFIDDVYDRKEGKVRDDMIIMVNGRNIKDLKREITLKDNDVVAVFPPLAGG